MLPVYICEDEEEIRRIQMEYLEKQILMEGYDMEILLKYLQYKNKKDFSEYGYIGNEVWKKLKN